MAVTAIARILLQKTYVALGKSIETLANHSHVVSDVLKAKEEGRGARCDSVDSVEGRASRKTGSTGQQPLRRPFGALGPLEPLAILETTEEACSE
jgi:hypothetical protein